MVVEEGMLAVLICSDSFGFFFLVDGRTDAELSDDDSDDDDAFGGADDTTEIFLLFFDSGFAVIDNVCVDFAVGLDNSAAN